MNYKNSNLIKLFLLIIFVSGQSCASVPEYQYKYLELPETFDEYYKNKLEQSKSLNVRPGNDERLVRYSDDKTPVAILYIHGFGASRAEGEYVIDEVAARIKANTYYIRLPGHGTNKEDHAGTEYNALLDESTDALHMMQKLGDNVIVIGTSLGGLLATYLASEFPDEISGVVLCSPFYELGSPWARFLHVTPLFKLVNLMVPIRISDYPVPPQKDNWTLYWYKEQNFSALKMLIDLTEYAAKKSVYEKIRVPVLLLYYYKDVRHKDWAASVPHMRKAFSHFGKSGLPNPLSREVAIVEGDHVLLSRYVESDWEKVIKEISEFIESIK